MATSIRREGRRCELSAANRLERVCVIIPVLNEAASLPLVLRDLPPVGRVVVVDNGSTDDSARVAREYGAAVVCEPRKGYGGACQAGLAAIREYALVVQPPSVVVFLDGDFSDHPEQLDELVAPVLEDRADFVIGSRMMGEREPGALLPQALFGNRLACFLMRLCWGARYTDLGPFRAIRWTALERLEMQDRNYGWTVEMQIKAVIAGLRIEERPVRYRRRVGVSKISGTVAGSIKAGWKILYTIARYRWLTWRRR